MTDSMHFDCYDNSGQFFVTVDLDMEREYTRILRELVAEQIRITREMRHAADHEKTHESSGGYELRRELREKFDQGFDEIHKNCERLRELFERYNQSHAENQKNCVGVSLKSTREL